MLNGRLCIFFKNALRFYLFLPLNWFHLCYTPLMNKVLLLTYNRQRIFSPDRFGPYLCQPVIAGLGDDDVPFICTMDCLGAKYDVLYPFIFM